MQCLRNSLAKLHKVSSWTEVYHIQAYSVQLQYNFSLEGVAHKMYLDQESLL